MKKILVVGSINVDLTTVTKTIPKKGETVIGESFAILPGGKGANQAVAASRLGANVSFYGNIGNDDFGNYLLNNFKKNNIDTKFIKKVDLNTGVANIIVHEGDNQIIVNRGANEAFRSSDFDKSILDNFDIISLQNEIDVNFTHFIIEEAFKKNKIIVFNPAPYNNDLSIELIDKATYIILNEIEANMMLGKDFKTKLKDYANKVIITLGGDGVIYFNGSEYVQVVSNNVPVIDTTGAGDTFCGAFISALSEGYSINSSITKANTAASYSIQKLGAQSAMPWKGEI